jgi:2-phospho-L-lactate guanylyltransferase
MAGSESMPSSSSRSLWTVIVPVKQITLAKSRLTGVDDDTRRALAVAFARDTVAAAASCPVVGQVIVVSNDDAASAIADGSAGLIPDQPDAGLNPALAHAATQIRRHRPDASVAALSSDLPALRGADLTLAFHRGMATPWFVPDAAGAGTTLLAAPAGQPWTPSFGADSRHAHRATGAGEIELDGLDRLRCDVDTAADLARARELGVGASTAAVLARARLV